MAILAAPRRNAGQLCVEQVGLLPAFGSPFEAALGRKPRFILARTEEWFFYCR